HQFLSSHLSFPFRARYRVQEGPFMQKQHPVTIVALLAAEEGDLTEGLLCEGALDDETIELPLADIEKATNRHNRRLIDDYAYWFATADDDEGEAIDFFPALPWFLPKTRMSFTVALMLVVLAGAMAGIVLGSLLAAIDFARVLAVCG